jgi:hypothetical protein
MEIVIKEFGVVVRLIIEPYVPDREEVEKECSTEKHVYAAHACIACEEPICNSCLPEHKKKHAALSGSCGCPFVDLKMREFGEFFCPKHDKQVEV